MDFCLSRQRAAWIRILAVDLKVEGTLSSISNRRISSVGIIGLGAMGGAIAKQLLDRHVLVSAFRRRGMEEFIRDGGIGCSSAEAVARSSRLLLLTLPDCDALASLFLDEGFLSALSAEHVIVSLGTYPLWIKKKARATAEDRQVAMLDCEISGTPHMIPARQASVFASGDRSIFEGVEHIFQLWSDRVTFLGEFGAATIMKLLAQQLVAVHTAAAAEAIALGTRCGLDAEAIVRVLSTSAAASAMLAVRGASMANEDFSPQGGTVASFAKSLKLVRQLAVDAHAPTPLLAIAHGCFEQATELGFGDADISSVLRVFT